MDFIEVAVAEDRSVVGGLGEVVAEMFLRAGKQLGLTAPLSPRSGLYQDQRKVDRWRRDPSPANPTTRYRPPFASDRFEARFPQDKPTPARTPTTRRRAT